jgi:hypothetical protein
MADRRAFRVSERLGEVGDELFAQLAPGPNRLRREVHQPGPSSASEGKMEVVGYDLRASPSCLDGGGVDLEELLRVDGPVVLLK